MIKNNKKLAAFIICLAVVGVFIASAVYAQTPEIDSNKLGAIERGIYYVVAYIAQIIVRIAGPLISNVVAAIVFVASWSDFINPLAVSTGWVVVRDITNLFFIIILLIVAFATILRIESYQYKEILPRLLIVAILINFSKTICGLLIDVGQVVMLTFVSGFSQAAGGNFITGFGIYEVLDHNPNISETVDLTDIAINYILAVIYLFIALVTLVVTLAILAFRIVLLWLLVVLSPAAFLLSTFPQGQGYAQTWWKEFTKAIAIGPILAFFIWLSLVAFTPLTDQNSRESVLRSELKHHPGIAQELKDVNQEIRTGSGVMGTAEAMISFVMAIGLMWGGIYVSQQLGGTLGSRAGSYAGKVMRYGSAPFRFAGRKVSGAAYNWAKRGVSENIEWGRYKIASLGGPLRRFSPEFKKEREMGRQERLEELSAKGRRRTAEGYYQAMQQGRADKAMFYMAGLPQEVMRRGRVGTYSNLVRMGAGRAASGTARAFGLKPTWGAQSEEELRKSSERVQRLEKQRREKERRKKWIENPVEAEDEMINDRLVDEKDRLSKLEAQKSGVQEGEQAQSGVEKKLFDYGMSNYMKQRHKERETMENKLLTPSEKNVENNYYSEKEKLLKLQSKLERLENMKPETRDEKDRIEAEKADVKLKIDNQERSVQGLDRARTNNQDTKKRLNAFDRNTSEGVKDFSQNSRRTAFDVRIQTQNKHVEQLENILKTPKGSDLRQDAIEEYEEKHGKGLRDEFNKVQNSLAEITDLLENPSNITNFDQDKIERLQKIMSDDEKEEFNSLVESAGAVQSANIKNYLFQNINSETL